MKKARLTEEQIIGILQEHEAGAKYADLCRKHGMSEGTFYAWKAKYSGMTVSEAKRLKALEDEHAKLKRRLAEQMLDLAAMKELLSKNSDARREARGPLQQPRDLADTNEEGANLVSLQTRQQLGIQALVFAGQSEQAVLRLFR